MRGAGHGLWAAGLLASALWLVPAGATGGEPANEGWPWRFERRFGKSAWKGLDDLLHAVANGRGRRGISDRARDLAATLFKQRRRVVRSLKSGLTQRLTRDQARKLHRQLSELPLGWGYSKAFCYDRAHLAALFATMKGYRVNKVLVAREGLHLRRMPKEPLDPDVAERLTVGNVGWDTHIAIIYEVEGEAENWVSDPALFPKGPVPESTWLAKIQGPKCEGSSCTLSSQDVSSPKELYSQHRTYYLEAEKYDVTDGFDPQPLRPKRARRRESDPMQRLRRRELRPPSGGMSPLERMAMALEGVANSQLLEMEEQGTKDNRSGILQTILTGLRSSDRSP